MKDNRHREIAKRYNILDKVESLEKDLLKIDGVAEIDWDLDGFLDNLHQVIFLTRYNIPVSVQNYYELRKKLRYEVLITAREHGLTKTEDTIEDYGEHFYWVFHHDSSWIKED